MPTNMSPAMTNFSSSFINRDRRRLTAAVILGSLGLSACSDRQTAANVAPGPAGKPQPISILSSLGAPSSPSSYASQASGPALGELYNQITTKMHGFTAGSAQSKVGIVVIFDPQCPHCGRLWAQSQRLWKEVQFAWLPVPLMNAESLNQGAMILGAPDPIAFMQEHEASILSNKGGTPLNATLFERGKSKIDVNRQLATLVRVDSVPLIFHKKANGEILATKGGMGAEELVVLIQS